MRHFKVQSHASLRAQMKAVARGEKPVPKDAGGTTFDSVEALLRLLTPQNRELLAVIRDKKPKSIAELPPKRPRRRCRKEHPSPATIELVRLSGQCHAN